jgi:hypothetical protein
MGALEDVYGLAGALNLPHLRNAREARGRGLYSPRMI